MNKNTRNLLITNRLLWAMASLAKLFIWFLLLFALARLIFMVVYSQMINQSGASIVEIAGAFIHSLRLDAATACYFSAVPVLFFTVWLVTNGRWIKNGLVAYSWFSAIVYGLMLGGELGLYGEWKTKLNYKALLYLQHPGEVFNSTGTGQFVLWIAVVAAYVWIATTLYRKWMISPLAAHAAKWWYPLVFLLATAPPVALGARGGIQEIPINQSQSYYSQHEVLNAASVNTAFNLYISIFENRTFLNKNPYLLMPRHEAEAIVKKLFTPACDSTSTILTTKRPNIVLIILESWSADLIESLGGEPGITPEFKKLESEGLLFTRVYAGGSRSEQGMAAIFSGFPPHPYTSITVQPDKYHKLASLPKQMNQAGYTTSFCFGGQLIYGNIKSYMMFTGFNRITEMDDFDDSLPRGKLGIHDQYTLDHLLNDIDKTPPPFFSALFTLSTHSPYDQPMEEKLNWGGNEKNYINSAYYTDWCLGRFFAEARTKPWYSNTLFVLIADHSHNSYRNYDPKTFQYNHIPMLWLGGAIRPEWRGKQFKDLASQTDLAVTLLKQLNINDTTFQWSRNVLNKCYKPFAYHVRDNGDLGWLKPDACFIEEMSFRREYYTNLPPDRAEEIKKEGYAFLQVLFQQYLDF